jgi:CelD/BcsL family acetyltransferase involved in cellulose biosynthesis
MQVETVTNLDGWQALEPDWNRVLERSASATVFLTMEWLWPWWCHFHRSRDSLNILVAREGNSIVGLAPLYRRRVSAYGLGSLGRIGFIGDYSGDSEYLDFIVEPGREAEALAMFFDHIEHCHGGWDLAELRLLPKRSPNLQPLRSLASAHGWNLLENQVPCSSVKLPGEWEEYLETLRPRRRQKVRASLRSLPNEHRALFDQCSSPQELSERLESLFELHQRRWLAVGEPGSFASTPRRHFYFDVANRLLKRGWLRLYSLRLNGRFVAHQFGFEYLGRLYDLQQCFDIDYDKLGLGNALTAFVIRDSISRGVRNYDFLGDTAPHKERWGARTETCVHLTLTRHSIRTAWRLGLLSFIASASGRIGRITPEPVRRFKRRLQKRLLQRGTERRALDEGSCDTHPKSDT